MAKGPVKMLYVAGEVALRLPNSRRFGTTAHSVVNAANDSSATSR